MSRQDPIKSSEKQLIRIMRFTKYAMQVVGGPFNIPSGQYIVTFETVHPSEKEHGPSKSYKETDFPVEIREFLNSINESLWNRVRHDLVQRFKLSSDEIPIYLEKHVFLVYKATNETSKQVAEKLGKFLQEKKMRIWYFPRKVGWGDSLAVDSLLRFLCLNCRTTSNRLFKAQN